MSDKEVAKGNQVSDVGKLRGEAGGAITRRDFMVGSAVVGTGAVALATLAQKEAAAQTATQPPTPAQTRPAARR